jgi:hypothetical protein
LKNIKNQKNKGGGIKNLSAKTAPSFADTFEMEQTQDEIGCSTHPNVYSFSSPSLVFLLVVVVVVARIVRVDGGVARGGRWV